MIYRLFGYDHLPMPMSIAELEAEHFLITDVLALEVRKAVALLRGVRPFLAPYRAWGLPLDDVVRLGEVIKECSPDGFITGSDLSDETLRAMRSAL